MKNITPKEGEEVLLHLRKSIFVLGKQMFIFAFSVVVSVLFLTFLYEYPIASVVAGILLVLALLYAFYYFIVWYYDVYTVTNMRVLVLARKNLFHSEFAEVSYREISSVSSQVKGIAATIFQYGNVVLTLNSGEKMELIRLSTPGVVQETLKNLIDVTRQRNS